jgi:acyl carrier protein
MNISDHEIRERAKIVLARTMKMTLSDLKDEIAQHDLSAWDSVHHMNVVLGLESEFDIQFPDSELPTLTSLPAIVEAVQRHLQE